MLGRVYPDISCEVIFEEAEWKSAYVITKKKRPPDKPPTLREMVRMVGQLGGHLGRKSDGEPGTKTIWKGTQRLKDIAFGWQSAQEARK